MVDDPSFFIQDCAGTAGNVLTLQSDGSVAGRPAAAGGAPLFAMQGGDTPLVLPNPTDEALPLPAAAGDAVLLVPCVEGDVLHLAWDARWAFTANATLILDWQSSPDGLAWSALNTLPGHFDSNVPTPPDTFIQINVEGLYTHVGADATMRFRIRVQVADAGPVTLQQIATMTAQKVTLQP